MDEQPETNDAPEKDDVLPNPHPKADMSDQSLIAEFQGLVETPNFLRQSFRMMEGDRKYVSEDCMLLKTQDTVAANHVLRNQYIGLAYLGVAEPAPFCQPARTVGNMYPPEVERFAETMEIHLSRQLQFMRFAEKLEGACQDASTNGIAWLKVSLQTDYMKDPLGRARFGDQQDNVAEYLALRAREADGAIIEGTAEWSKLRDLEQTLRVYAAGKMEEQIKAVPVLTPQEVPVVDPLTGTPLVDPNTLAPITQVQMVPDPTDPRELQRQAVINGSAPLEILGLPEVEQFQGFACDQVQAEDMRWDWSATRPEDIIDGDWIAHRVFMWPRDVFAKFQHVDKEDLAGVDLWDKNGNQLNVKYGGETASEALDPAMRVDLETTAVNGRMAVWELWHKKLGRRYVFVPGARKFLANEVPQAVGARWYPFFPIYFNRVTGKAMPLSDVLLQRPLQDEYNTLRSHDREARRAAYPVVFAPKGLFDKGAEDAYRNRKPFSIVTVDRPQDITQAIKESVTIPYNPSLYNTNAVVGDMQAMAGIPTTVAGVVGQSEVASEIALAKEGMEQGVTRRRTAVNRVINDILRYMAEISIRAFPEKYMQQVCGVAAVWPKLTCEELYTNIHIEVKGGLSGAPRTKDRIDLWANFASIAQSLALPVNGPEVLRELLTAMGIRVDFRRFIAPIMPMMPPPGGSPAPPGGQGREGGAPLMVDRGAPSSLDQVPNRPEKQMPPMPDQPPA